MISRLWSWAVLVSLLFPTVASFLVSNKDSCLFYRDVKMEMAGNNDGVAGSFFNPVPPPDDDDNDAKDSKKEEINDVFDFDQSVAELMRNRNKKSRASTPSTLGGVPTAKATGFGKKANDHKPRVIKTSNDSNSKSFVGIGKPMNDVNNPQYDDQGYTLYADEETGEQKRVFEALVEYPCDFTMKVIGVNEGAFVSEIVAVVAESCNVDVSSVKFSERKKGKYTSVTVKAPVDSAEMVYTLYENIDRDPRVKFKF